MIHCIRISYRNCTVFYEYEWNLLQILQKSLHSWMQSAVFVSLTHCEAQEMCFFLLDGLKYHHPHASLDWTQYLWRRLLWWTLFQNQTLEKVGAMTNQNDPTRKYMMVTWHFVASVGSGASSLTSWTILGFFSWGWLSSSSEPSYTHMHARAHIHTHTRTYMYMFSVK